jgi:nucleolar protein 12
VAWKNNTTTNSDPDGDGTPSKTYITPAEKKRIAFIKGEFHEEAGSTNAYAVIAHPHPHATSSSSPSSSKDPDKKSSNEAAYDPYIAAGLLVEKMNGTHFMGRTLRLDRVGRHPGVGVGVGSNSDAGADAISTRDPAATIFVGNLDFTAKEEDVRAFFETLLTVEIGPARAKDSKNDGENNDENDSAGSSSDEDANPSDNKMDIDSENKLHWVRSVRIVRDKDTQLGKGFAYIRFSVSSHCLRFFLFSCLSVPHFLKSLLASFSIRSHH